MAQYAAAIDQGTTSTRFMVFDHGGQVVSVDQKEHEQIYPKPGWVEHDPMEIWERTQEVVRAGLDKVQASDIAAVGVTNQRETTVVWDRSTGQPGPQRDRVAGHPHGPDLQRAVRRRRAGPVPGEDRPADRHVLLRSEDQVDPRQRRRSPRQGRERRDPVREHRHVGDLAAHRRGGRRRPRDRRDERQPHDDDEPRDARLGRRDPRDPRRPSRDAAADPGLERGLRRGQGRPGRNPGRRRPRRPAGGALRPDLLRRRRGQEHLRDGQLPPPEHRERGRPVQERPADDARLQDRRSACHVLPGRRDRDHGRARPVAAGQPRPDQGVGRGRGAREDGRGQRRDLLRPRLLGPLRPVLAGRGPGRDRRD